MINALKYRENYIVIRECCNNKNNITTVLVIRRQNKLNDQFVCIFPQICHFLYGLRDNLRCGDLRPTVSSG